jgi:CRP/FNR family cyclic AMP-dependent transcriptional regulator
MRGPYGFEVIENCQACKLRSTNFFCQMPAAALKDFNTLRSSAAYPKGAVLFIEKQEARGVFVLCEGQVKLSIGSSDGKTMIVHVAKPGELLGVTAVATGAPYEATAETLRPSQVAFIRREDFLRFMGQHPETYQFLLKQVASSYSGACEQLRTVGLSASASERLARFLLDIPQDSAQLRNQITLPLTHEEIGECIGSSRETVTRTFSELKSRELISIKGSTVTIPNRAALEELVSA